MPMMDITNMRKRSRPEEEALDGQSSLQAGTTGFQHVPGRQAEGRV